MTQQPASKRRIRQPPLRVQQPRPKKTPTLEKVHTDIRKAFAFQLNTFTAQFLQANTDEDIEAFLPEDITEADRWVEGLVEAFLDNEEPSVEDMLSGVSAIFMMAFLERLYEHCGIAVNDDDPEDEPEDEPEDDAEDELDGDTEPTEADE